MYGLLQVRIHLHHLVVQVVMITHQDLWIPSYCHKNGVDAGAERRGEEVAYLQTDEEREGNNNYGEVSVRVVWRIGELEP